MEKKYVVHRIGNTTTPARSSFEEALNAARGQTEKDGYTYGVYELVTITRRDVPPVIVEEVR